MNNWRVNNTLRMPKPVEKDAGCSRDCTSKNMSAMQRGTLISGGWTRGGTSEVVRRAHPASGAQWNVQVVRGKVNGKCLWNACKALSLGLLLMVLGAAMATIGTKILLQSNHRV